ncbi:MAG: Response regulator containing a CheY-like receiver domain and an domain [Myxococcaceae bacterium]|nr:Response regulator containing a CheY-like receiver domain and an domain [Myxococcaceae bacterium]
MDDVAPADVLVVEDDPDLNEMIGAYVRLAGYGYRPALDGAMAARELGSRRPALVLLDLMLPDMDGFEVCRRLREDPATRDVPVVVLSAVNETESRRRAQELDVVEYLTKPFDPDALMDAVQRHAASR